MKKIAILSKPDKEELRELAPRLVSWLKGRGCDVVFDEETGSYLEQDGGIDREQLAEAKPDLLIVMGGDGTLLTGARVGGVAGIPILGVNLGTVGFLVEVLPSEIFKHLEDVLGGRFVTEERAMVHCKVEQSGNVLESFHALNDVVVNCGTYARMARFHVELNNEPLAVIKADALVLATPTGSTAYTLAAGGPILAPGIAGFVLTAVSPYRPTDRPIVLPDDSTITFWAEPGNADTYLTIDGQINRRLETGQRVVCRRSDRAVELIRPDSNNVGRFYEALRSKLKWGAL